MNGFQSHSKPQRTQRSVGIEDLQESISKQWEPPCLNQQLLSMRRGFKETDCKYFFMLFAYMYMYMYRTTADKLSDLNPSNLLA